MAVSLQNSIPTEFSLNISRITSGAIPNSPSSESSTITSTCSTGSFFTVMRSHLVPSGFTVTFISATRKDACLRTAPAGTADDQNREFASGPQLPGPDRNRRPGAAPAQHQNL